MACCSGPRRWPASSTALIALKALPRARPTEPAADAAQQPRSGYLALLADRRYLFFLAAVLLVSIVYCQYTAALPLAIVRAGLSLRWYSAIVALNAVVVATCEVAATRFVQAWPLRLTVLTGFGLVAIGVRHVRDRAGARYFGAMQSVFGLGAAIGPILGAALWDHLGQELWLWAAAVAVIAAVCAQAGMRRPQRHSET